MKIFLDKDSEAVTQRCSIKKAFFETSQISQESTCARVYFLTKLQAASEDSRHIFTFRHRFD